MSGNGIDGSRGRVVRKELYGETSRFQREEVVSTEPDRHRRPHGAGRERYQGPGRFE